MLVGDSTNLPNPQAVLMRPEVTPDRLDCLADDAVEFEPVSNAEFPKRLNFNSSISVRLPDPQVPPGAGDRHRSDRPADGKPMGCRRTGCLGHPFGDLERGVRCNGHAAAFDSVYTSQGKGGDAGELM